MSRVLKYLTEKEVSQILSNPFYAIKVNEMFNIDHEFLVSEKDWIKANVKLIEEMGAEKWLKMLINNLKGNYITYKE